MFIDGRPTFITARSPSIDVESPSQPVAKSISENAERATVAVGSVHTSFRGFYSALIPNDPRELHYITASGYYFSNQPPVIEAMRLIHNGVTEVFVKGVKSSFGAERHSHGRWVPPRILINLDNPSALHPNLARTATRIEDVTWHVQFWSEVADQLQPLFLPDASGDPLDDAWGIGAALEFGSLPVPAVMRWRPPDLWPVLAFTEDRGVDWIRFQAAREHEILEAPVQASYCVSKLLANPVQPGHWLGPPAVVVGQTSFPAPHPSLEAAVATAGTMLQELGYAPTTVSLLAPPPGDPVPVVCRVWSPLPAGVDDHDARKIAEQWQANPGAVHPNVLNRVMGSELPQLVHFPDVYTDTAAIGSLFWNRDHPKIKAIVAALLSLAAVWQRSELPRSLAQRFDAWKGLGGFIRYELASRVASTRMAIDRVHEFLAIAAEAGLVSEGNHDPLSPSDFLPGTLGRYENPIWYDFSAWSRDGVKCGAPISTSWRASGGNR